MPLRPAALAAATLALVAAGCGSKPVTHEGSLAAGDETLQTGEFVDTYNIPVKKGQWILADMTSEVLDPYLIVRSPAGNQTENDDLDSTSARRALVRQQATEDGAWVIGATSFEPGEEGAYRLVVSVTDDEPPMPAPAAAAPGAAPARTRPTRATADTDAPAASASGERVVSGELTARDATLDDGEYADGIKLVLAEGQSYTIDLRSDAFDPYLMLVPPSGDQTENDDFEGALDHARLSGTAAVAGVYRVVVTSASSGESGAYTLTIR